MSTHVATSNPVRSDVRYAEDHTSPNRRTNSRLWALSGLGAGVLGLATIVTSSMVDVVYRDEFKGTTDGVAKALEDKTGVLFAFHSITTVGAVLMVVFAAGLFHAITAVADRYPRWGIDFLYGVVALALGVYIVASWPISSFWVLGTVVGIEIIARGVALVSASWALRSIEHGELPSGMVAA